jgi:diguanylate cyclase (GGDEF)-like protein
VELRTLSLVQACILTLVALMLWVSRRAADRHNGLSTWSAAIALEAAGHFLLAFAPALPEGLGTMAGHGLVAAGAALTVAALRRFAGDPTDGRWLVAAMVAAAALAGAASTSVAVETLFDGLGYGALALLNAWTLWPAAQPLKSNPHAGGALRSQYIVVGCYALMGFALPLRAAASFVFGPDVGQPGLPAPWEAMGVVASFVCFVVTRLGFVLMCMRRAEAEARLHALTDDLTGLGNRRALDEAMARALASATRRGTVFSIAMADIDGLQAINAALGHRAGDAALLACATRLRSAVRGDDFAFRHGGDTFCVVMSATEPAGAQTAALRWRERVSSPATPTMHALSACFGVTSWKPGDDADALLGRADRALARAKSLGRDRVEAG